MKKTILLAALAPWMSLAGEVDGIAAVVGTERILKSDVIQEMVRLEAPKEAYTTIRNELINRKLILRAAADAKMTMQDWVVESRIREIIERGFGGDRNKLMELLSKQKVAYPEWHQRMKEDMIIGAMRWNVVDKNVTARPVEIRKEYLEHRDRYAKPAKVTVSVILLKPEDAMLREEVSAALATEDFAAVAKRCSADEKAAEGGVWADVVASEAFSAEVADEIAKMPVHTLSHWIELGGWSFLLRKDAETPGEALTFEEAYEEVLAAVREREENRLYDAWIERLRAETYIKVY